MSAPPFGPRIGIYGPDPLAGLPKPGFVLWTAGCAAAVAAAGGTPVAIEEPPPDGWDSALDALDGVVLLGADAASPDEAGAAELCRACRARRLPLLAIDGGLHALNAAFGGALHLDVPRELPQALQHLGPPEPGDRHAAALTPGTRLAGCYEGEEELVVPSAHRRAVSRVARGFAVSARALDGVVEAIEAEADDWFALGVQWQPAAVEASGTDIQLFRAFVAACGGGTDAALAGAALAAA